jgi:integrase
MKEKNKHIIPISTELLRLLEELHVITGAGPDSCIFPSYWHKDIGYDAGATQRTFLKYVKEYPPHHIRKLFVKWIQDNVRINFDSTKHDQTLQNAIDIQLGHQIGTEVSKIYQLGPETYMLHERRIMLEEWSSYLEQAGKYKPYTKMSNSATPKSKPIDMEKFANDNGMN